MQTILTYKITPHYKWTTRFRATISILLTITLAVLVYLKYTMPKNLTLSNKSLVAFFLMEFIMALLLCVYILSFIWGFQKMSIDTIVKIQQEDNANTP